MKKVILLLSIVFLMFISLGTVQASPVCNPNVDIKLIPKSIPQEMNLANDNIATFYVACKSLNDENYTLEVPVEVNKGRWYDNAYVVGGSPIKVRCTTGKWHVQYLYVNFIPRAVHGARSLGVKLDVSDVNTSNNEYRWNSNAVRGPVDFAMKWYFVPSHVRVGERADIKLYAGMYRHSHQDMDCDEYISTYFTRYQYIYVSIKAVDAQTGEEYTILDDEPIETIDWVCVDSANFPYDPYNVETHFTPPKPHNYWIIATMGYQTSEYNDPDNSNNTIRRLLVSYDDIPPELNVISPEGNVEINVGSSVLVKWLATDNSGSVSVDVNCGNGTEFNGLPAEGNVECEYNAVGEYELTVRAIDGSGNEATVVREVNVVGSTPSAEKNTFDFYVKEVNTPDSIETSSEYNGVVAVGCEETNGHDWIEKNVPYRIMVEYNGNVVKDENGSVELNCVLGGTVEKNLEVSFLAENQGTYTIRVIVEVNDVNNADNVVEWNVDSLPTTTPDTTPPELNVISPEGNVEINVGSSVLVKWLATDNSGSVSVDVNCGNGTEFNGLPAEGNVECEYNAVGEYNLSIRAVDPAGNEAWKSFWINVVEMNEENQSNEENNNGSNETSGTSGGGAEYTIGIISGGAPTTTTSMAGLSSKTIKTGEKNEEKEKETVASGTTYSIGGPIYLGQVKEAQGGKISVGKVGTAPITGYAALGAGGKVGIFLVVFLLSLVVFLRVL